MEQNAAAELPLSDRLWVWFEANGKQAIWMAVGAIVIVFIIALYVWNKNQSEVKASQALSKVEVQIAISGGRRDSSSQMYLKVASDYAGTAAAGRAMLQAGAGLFAQAKYAEAQSQFERFTREHGRSPFIPQAMLGIATSLEAQGKTDEAAKAYEALVKNHASSVVAPQAEFAMANILESQGRYQEAWFIFEKLARGGLDTSIGSEAGMRAEELKDKLPAAAAPAAPSASDAAIPFSTLSNSPAPAAATTNQP